MSAPFRVALPPAPPLGYGPAPAGNYLFVLLETADLLVVQRGAAPGPRSPATTTSPKAVVLTAAAIALFFTPVPAPLTALGIAGAVLTSRRMHTRDMLALVDWHLLALFIGLFIVGRGFELSGWTEAGRNALAAGAMLLWR